MAMSPGVVWDYSKSKQKAKNVNRKPHHKVTKLKSKFSLILASRTLFWQLSINHNMDRQYQRCTYGNRASLFRFKVLAWCSADVQTEVRTYGQLRDNQNFSIDGLTNYLKYGASPGASLWTRSGKLSVSLSICPSVRLSLCLSVCLSVCLFVFSPFLSIFLCLSLFGYSFIYLKYINSIISELTSWMMNIRKINHFFEYLSSNFVV